MVNESEEGIEKVIKKETMEAEKIIELKLQDLRLDQQKVEQLKQAAVEASDAEFV
jgi:hypothetical protein